MKGIEILLKFGKLYQKDIVVWCLVVIVLSLKSKEKKMSGTHKIWKLYTSDVVMVGHLYELTKYLDDNGIKVFTLVKGSK